MRPSGFKRETCGVQKGSSQASVDVHISWPDCTPSPPTSEEVLKSLLPWLHDWLLGLKSGAQVNLSFEDDSGARIDI
jgi:hypothetical protein